MLTTVLIVINVFAALSVIVLALMQQSKSDMGAAFGGGGSQSMFGSRGSANFLSRTTAIMTAAFFISSLALAYQYSHRTDVQKSVIDQASAQIESSSKNTAPADDAVPALPQQQADSVEQPASDVPAVPE